MQDVSENEICFKEKIEAVAGAAPETIIGDGRIHRFADGQDAAARARGRKGKQAGWYVFHGTHGAFGTWHEGETHTWHSGERAMATGAARVTPEERRGSERVRLERELLANSLRASAAQTANVLWGGATERADHGYLQRKQIGAGRVARYKDQEVVVVGMTHDGQRVMNAQLIDADGEKTFLPGGRVKGCFHVIGAMEKEKRVLLAEGYATGRSLHMATQLPVVVAMSCGNLAVVAQRVVELWPKSEVMVCADNDAETAGNPGVREGLEAAKAVKGRFVVPVFKNRAGATDFNDLAVTEGLETVRTQIEQAWFSEPLTYSEEEIVARLAGLSAAEYQAQRRKWATYLGRKVAELEGMVAGAREGAQEGAKPPEEQAWGEPVDGASLLTELRETIQRHVVVGEPEAVACALWIAHTYIYDRAKCQTPILNITSATKRCGKSTLLSLLTKLVNGPKASAGISGAAIYRTIERFRPTLLVDEADNVVSKEKNDLLSVLNAGISPDLAKVIRCQGETLEPKEFDTYCAKVLAGIGARVDTLEDRSITITLRRKPTDVKVQRVRLCCAEEIRRQLRRWASDNGEAVAETYKRATTALPEALDDRQQDMWEILFALADRAGGDWPRKAREAAVTLCGRSGSEPNLSELLLADCHRYREENFAIRVFSKELVEWLNRQEERPWKDLRHGHGIDQRGLRSMLAGFGVFSKPIRIGTGVARGYDFDDFAQAFGAYIHQAEATAAEDGEAEEPGEAGCVASHEEAGERYTGAAPERSGRVGGEA